MVDVLVTTAGGIEEDVIKSLKPFVLGSFNANPREMFDKGVNRIGNIFVTNDRYLHFEKFMNPFIAGIYKEQKKKGKIFCTFEILSRLGKHVDSKESILYWAYKNDIPVFCPALTDGAFGDLIFWQKQRTKDFCVDITQDMSDIVKIALNADKTGVICLGGGTAKHYTLNAQIFREGAAYAVYINTGNEYEGSDSGAAVDEAMTWAKVKTDALNVKVHGDATIIFPLVVAGVLEGKKNLKESGCV
jgi:deoxyhypusine synthase